MGKRKLTDGMELETIELYKNGMSTTEVGECFSVVSATIYNTLEKHGVARRSVSEGNSLKWKNPDFRKNQVEKRTGKPSGALGKTWSIDHVVKKPNLCGSKNHFWKGGKTGLSNQIKNSAEYAYWRTQVFKRDDFTCQICRRSRKACDRVILNAHHVYPFSKIFDDFNITTIGDAISCKLLWDVDNGQTLCVGCHRETDTWGSNQYAEGTC